MKKIWSRYKNHITIVINVLFVATLGYVTFDFLVNEVLPTKTYFVLLALMAMCSAVGNSLDLIIRIIESKMTGR